MFFLSNNVTGIDIGSKNIKIVSVKSSKDRIYVDKALIIEMPQLSEYDKDGFRISFSLINEYSRKKDISLKNVAILCPNYLYNTVYLMLPKMKRKQDIKSAILWELKNKYNVEFNDITLDYFEIGEVDNKVEYQVYYAEKNKIEEIQKEAMKLNINIKYIDIDHIAYSMCFNKLYPHDDNIKVLLDIGYQKSLIIFLQKEKILFSRELNLGLINIFNHLTNEEIKSIKIKGILHTEISESIRHSITEVMLEISKTIDYFINGLKYSAPSSIFCNGGFFAIPGMYNYFKENLPYPVMLNNVLELVNYKGEFRSNGFMFHLALGVATI
jgi:type IV pilus assembly protein PilM